jgi:hypothetical protein
LILMSCAAGGVVETKTAANQAARRQEDAAGPK